MANPEHVERLLRAVRTGDGSWNRWRADRPDERPDLCDLMLPRIGDGVSVLGLDIRGFDFRNADLRGADFYRTWLVQTDFTEADLRGAILGEVTAGGAIFEHARLAGANLMSAQCRFARFTEAFLTDTLEHSSTTEGHVLSVDSALFAGGPALLIRADLWGAKLHGARMSGVDLREANLRNADLTGADLSGANLQRAQLVEAIVDETNFHGCKVHGLAAWNLSGQPANQRNLLITPDDVSPGTADHLLAAQFLSVLGDRDHISPALESLTQKLVLILGRFSDERKRVLEAVRDRLQETGWVPILYDFDPIPGRGVTQTFKMGASLARFVVCDVTDATEVRSEFRYIAEQLPATPIQPILLNERDEWFGLEEERRNRRSILATFRYADEVHLMKNFAANVVDSSLAWLRSR